MICKGRAINDLFPLQSLLTLSLTFAPAVCISFHIPHSWTVIVISFVFIVVVVVVSVAFFVLFFNGIVLLFI